MIPKCEKSNTKNVLNCIKSNNKKGVKVTKKLVKIFYKKKQNNCTNVRNKYKQLGLNNTIQICQGKMSVNKVFKMAVLENI